MIAQLKIRAFLTSIVAMRGWAMRDEGNGFVLELPLPTGRTQVVHLTPSRDADGVEVVFFWSVAAPANRVPDPWFLLQENLQLSYGDYAVKDGNVIVLTSRIADYLNADELARVLYFIAKYADELEQRLLGPGYDAN